MKNNTIMKNYVIMHTIADSLWWNLYYVLYDVIVMTVVIGKVIQITSELDQRLAYSLPASGHPISVELEHQSILSPYLFETHCFCSSSSLFLQQNSKYMSSCHPMTLQIVAQLVHMWHNQGTNFFHWSLCHQKRSTKLNQESFCWENQQFPWIGCNPAHSLF